MFSFPHNIPPAPSCECCGAEAGADHKKDCNWLGAMKADAYPRILDDNGRYWEYNLIDKLQKENAELKKQLSNKHSDVSGSITPLPVPQLNDEICKLMGIPTQNLVDFDKDRLDAYENNRNKIDRGIDNRVFENVYGIQNPDTRSAEYDFIKYNGVDDPTKS